MPCLRRRILWVFLEVDHDLSVHGLLPYVLLLADRLVLVVLWLTLAQKLGLLGLRQVPSDFILHCREAVDQLANLFVKRLGGLWG